jgi:hypothetical protein
MLCMKILIKLHLYVCRPVYLYTDVHLLLPLRCLVSILRSNCRRDASAVCCVLFPWIPGCKHFCSQSVCFAALKRFVLIDIGTGFTEKFEIKCVYGCC